MVEKTLSNLKVKNRYVIIQEELKKYILANGLKPGDRLPTEQSLAKQLGVSRTSLREALKSLQALGIIDAKPGEGMVVRAFNFDAILGNLSYGMIFERTELMDLLEIRESLELAFVSKAVEKIKQEEIEELEDILTLMNKKATQNQLFDEEDAMFHHKLFLPVGNYLLLSLLDVFWEVLHKLRDPIEVERDPLGSYERHRKVLEAVKNRNPEQARACLSDHFVSIKERVESAVQKRYFLIILLKF